MILYEIMLNYLKEKADNQMKEFQRAALEQYIDEECIWDPSKKNLWAQKAKSLKAGLTPDYRWDKIMREIEFGEHQPEALNNTVNFGKKIIDVAKATEIDLEAPNKAKLDLSFLTKNNDGEKNK